MTCDIWWVTCETWHLTHDRWGRWTFFQNVSFLAGVKVLWRYEDPYDEGPLGPQWISWQIMVDFHILLKKISRCMCTVCCDRGPCVTHQCLGNQILMIFLILKAKLDHHIFKKNKVYDWPILDQGKKVCSHLHFRFRNFSWKPISIEAITEFITGLNQLWALNWNFLCKCQLFYFFLWK